MNEKNSFKRYYTLFQYFHLIGGGKSSFISYNKWPTYFFELKGVITGSSYIENLRVK